MTRLKCKHCGLIQEPCVSGFNREMATGYIVEVHLCKNCNHVLATQVYELKTTNYVNGEEHY